MIIISFITFTGSTDWPELKKLIKTGEDYVHHADLVCRIFMDKFEEFMRDITKNKVFGNVIGWCYSIEHQKRGWNFFIAYLHFINYPNTFNFY